MLILARFLQYPSTSTLARRRSESGGSMTATTGSAGQPRVQLFSRASSGLIRELSFSDTVWYGVFSGGALFGFVYLFPTPQYVSQGISIPLMLVFTLLYGVVIYFVYA